MEISMPSLMILIIGIIVISFCICCFLFFFFTEHEEFNNINQRETNLERISIGNINPEIDKDYIKRYKFKKNDKTFNCPYSLKKVEINDDVIQLLNCKHQFIVDEKKLSLKFVALNGCMVCRDKSCINKKLKGDENV